MHTLIHSSRKYVLDPYVISPLDSLLQHTKPHLTPLKPYAAPLEPYVSSTIEFAQTRIIPGASNVLSLAAAQYETHIASRLRWLFIEQYWNGVVQPNYFKKLHPKLELYSRPLRVYYTHTIIPGAQKALIYTHEAYTRVRPSTIYHFRVARRNARSVYATTKPRVIGAYEAVESLVLKGYAHVHPYLVAVVDMWKAQALFVAQRAQDARQKFVDPHVQLIWDKVVERSGSPTAAPVPTSVTDEPLSVRTSSATRLYTRPTQPEPESQKI
ncbi:hypothetical protein H0H81_011901 [Sphagnurus paluster]|uniref:Uncharacterized protein n=1 Tax=Sphagnurus paluster TaxID=117069 RepID=A0A9P7FWJ7_9AGAR|nr:hypothetical protein H0H81_011901 [Sphagnurus paluster]